MKRVCTEVGDSYADSTPTINRISMETRTILLYDFIDERFSVEIGEKLRLLDSIRDAPIYIKINCMGGLMIDTQAIIAELSKCQNKIIVDIVGCAYSGAAMISLAGDEVRMSRFALMMLHFPNWESESMDLKGHELDVKVMKEYFNRLMKELLVGTKITMKEFTKMASKSDIYLTPKQCLALGLVHKVY